MKSRGDEGEAVGGHSGRGLGVCRMNTYGKSIKRDKISHGGFRLKYIQTG